MRGRLLTLRGSLLDYFHDALVFTEVFTVFRFCELKLFCEGGLNRRVLHDVLVAAEMLGVSWFCVFRLGREGRPNGSVDFDRDWRLRSMRSRTYPVVAGSSSDACFRRRRTRDRLPDPEADVNLYEPVAGL